MPGLTVQTTTIREAAGGAATVEMLIADTSTLETATEGLFLRTAITQGYPGALVQFQTAALERARSLLTAEIQARQDAVKKILGNL